jgi:hypothetical protein
MADRFRREIRDVHQLRKDARSLPSTKIVDFMKRLGDEAADDWVFRPRDAPLPPSDLSWCWLFLGGRGAGKSHSMPAAVHMAVRAGISRIHLIAPTTVDFHSRVEAASWRPAVAIRRCLCFSGEEPEPLRGPQCHGRRRCSQSHPLARGSQDRPVNGVHTCNRSRVVR